jgi:tellurite resistance protein TerC
MSMQTSVWLWGAFGAVLVALLVFDLGVVGRQKGVITVRESLLLTAGYVIVALVFGSAVFVWQGHDAGLEYLTGFVLEKSLSIDNIFVFVLIFNHFHVPREYQHRVLFWGVLGALVMRAVMIFAGAAVLRHFEWVIYIFGAIVIASGVRIMLKSDDEPDLEQNRILRFIRVRLPMTEDYEGHRFVVHRQGTRYATPLLLALITIELTDLVFALDSIPAIFGVTRDEFIIYTSNAFAILGLRALHFAVARLMRKFIYLHYGLSIVLILIGAKMIVEGFVHIPVWLTLLTTILVIAGAVVLSLIRTRREKAAAE